MLYHTQIILTFLTVTNHPILHTHQMVTHVTGIAYNSKRTSSHLGVNQSRLARRDQRFTIIDNPIRSSSTCACRQEGGGGCPLFDLDPLLQPNIIRYGAGCCRVAVSYIARLKRVLYAYCAGKYRVASWSMCFFVVRWCLGIVWDLLESWLCFYDRYNSKVTYYRL